MGVGDAYLGTKQLLISRGSSFPAPSSLPIPRSPTTQTNTTSNTPTDSRPLIPCILSFVTGTLRPVKSETDPQLSPWYKSHSRIYVSPEHSCWTDPESAKKVRKSRFGGVRASDFTGLNSMLTKHLTEGTQWVEEMVRMRYQELGMGETGEGGDETESEGRE
jgi:histone deacetylase 6